MDRMSWPVWRPAWQWAPPLYTLIESIYIYVALQLKGTASRDFDPFYKKKTPPGPNVNTGKNGFANIFAKTCVRVVNYFMRTRTRLRGHFQKTLKASYKL